MSDRVKKIFLGASIVVPFMIYCVYYYAGIIGNAPYKFTEFQSFDFRFGLGNNLNNTYDSKTGRYQYVNNHDSLVVKKVFLSKDELLFLHRKAADLGFWDFPKQILGDTTGRAAHPSLHYDIAFHYLHKSKEVHFDEAYDEDIKLRDAAQQLIKQIQSTLADAEDREK